MTRKTRRIVLLIAVPLAVLLAAGAAAFLRAAPAAAAADVPEAKYLLRRCDGMVAVFLPGRDTPEYITDTPVSSLPRRTGPRCKPGCRSIPKRSWRGCLRIIAAKDGCVCPGKLI